jgi:hypothetical protein
MEAATLNNRGSDLRQVIVFRWLFLYMQGLNVVAIFEIEIFDFSGKDAACLSPT